MTQPANVVVQYIGLQGPPGPVSANVTSLASLAALPLNPASSLNGMLVGYTPSAGGQTSYYQWAPSNTDTPNGADIVAGNGGNWLLYRAGPLSVTARTGLTALADALLVDGAPVFNSESGYQADWVLRKTSTLTVDNLTVVPTASGVGRFVLKSRIAGVIPFTQVGADPTGAADSSTALVNAVAACVAAGVALQVPAGTYNIGTAPTTLAGLMLSVAPGVTWTGSGATAIAALAAPFSVLQRGAVGSPIDTLVASVQPVDLTRAPWGIVSHGQEFSGVWDYVTFIGWNPINGYNAQAISRFGMEYGYEVGGQLTNEVYLELYSPGQTNQVRPWFTNFTVSLGTTQTLGTWINASDSSALGYWQFQNYGGTLIARFLDTGAEFFEPLLGGQSGSPLDVVLSSFVGSSVVELERVCPTATGPTSGSSKGVIRTLDYVQTTGATAGQNYVSGPGGAQYSPPSGRGCSVTMHWTCRDESNGAQYGGIYRAEFQNVGSGAVLVAQGQVTGSAIGTSALSTSVAELFASGGKIAFYAQPPSGYGNNLQWKLSCEIVEV